MTEAYSPSKPFKVMLLRLAAKHHNINSHPVGIRPPYTLKYIEALLATNTVVLTNLIDEQILTNSQGPAKERILSWAPNIIVFDISPLNTNESNKVLDHIIATRGNQKIITIGIGQETSVKISNSSKLLSKLDIIVPGEAEIKVVSIITKIISGGTIKNPTFFHEYCTHNNKVEIIEELDKLPLLRYRKTELKKYSFVYPLKLAKKLKWGHVLSSRGCPHLCLFCSQLMRETYGNKVRLRSAGNVVDEIEHIIGLGANIISFDDENFTSSNKHVRTICNEIIKRGLKIHWIAHARVDEVDEHLLELMAQSGCVLIRYGIETSNKRILKLLKKTNDPDLWTKLCLNAVNLAHLKNISVAALFMIGCPTEEFDELEKNIEFAKELSPDIIQVSFFTPYSCSSSHKLVNNLSQSPDYYNMYHYDFPDINFTNMTDEDLKRAQKLFYRKFLLRSDFLVQHIRLHLSFYLFNPKVFIKLSGVLKLMT